VDDRQCGSEGEQAESVHGFENALNRRRVGRANSGRPGKASGGMPQARTLRFGKTRIQAGRLRPQLVAGLGRAAKLLAAPLGEHVIHARCLASPQGFARARSVAFAVSWRLRLHLAMPGMRERVEAPFISG
jgi:hypothetical protein